MGSIIKKYFFILIESYLAISIIAIIAAFIWPDTLKHFNGYTTLMLQVIFFFSILKIDLRGLWTAFKDYRPLVLVNLYMLVLLPVIVFFVCYFLFPSLTIPLVLLAAMPTAMSTPLFVQIVKGNMPYALILTVTTSLLAPFTIPLVLKVLLGSVVHIDAIAMMLKLMNVIFVPFILAQIYKATLNKKLSLTQFSFKGLSILLLGLLITSIIANNVAGLKEVEIGTILYYLIAMTVFYVFLHIVGYYLVYWQKSADAMTTAIAVTYMNFVLSLFIAGKYFNTVDVVIPLIVSILPWTILLIPYQKALKYFHKIV